jgi:nucleoside-specific outer membrane channel protein Tsx
MKGLKILALVTMLALGFTLSAQAQSQNTTGSDQYTTQTAGQTTSTPAASDSSMSTEQSTASSTSVYTNTDSGNNSKFATTVSDQDNREPQSEIDYLQQFQNDSGAN